MMHSFPELTIGGVLIAPFVTYAGATIAIFALLRPFLRLIGFDRVLTGAEAVRRSAKGSTASGSGSAPWGSVRSRTMGPGDCKDTSF